MKSELAIKGLFSNIIPYIKQAEENELYPTSGEGRKKLLTYAIYNIMANEHSEKKINLFLIEEPENHLHRSMQIAISKMIFNDNHYKYLFLSTHSPYIVQEMDNVNLVRIFNEEKISSESKFYEVPIEYKNNRKILNKGLSEAVFADKVLLVEGSSELLLFEKVLSVTYPEYEVEGIFILPVNGIAFEKYFQLLDELSIKNIVKTDNDLRIVSSSNDYSVLGFSRVNLYLPEDSSNTLPTDRITLNTVDSRRNLYRINSEILDNIREENDIHLSKCDLENDLDEIEGLNLNILLNTEDPVKYLHEKKYHHMLELVENLTDEDCKLIFNHYNFMCLKEIVK